MLTIGIYCGKIIAMKKETNLCMSCMTSITPGAALTHAPGECPHCSWIDNGVYLASYLYPKTFLAERYIAGKLISYNGEAALYAGYDTLTENKITIKEYMPDALCTRARDVLPLTVNSGELPLYKTYLSEFIELNRSLQSFGSSPGIQKITDVFTENSTAYAVHEDVSGISLADYLSNVGGTLSPEQVRELFPPVFTTLARINTAGIIHRGISPKTVFVKLINGAPVVYITDFAITAARIYGSKINEEVFAGYAAPEQYNSVERHGDWTDVYGLAALLYNVLTGIVPQDAPTRLTDDRLVEPMLINGVIPSNISKAIMKGMELTADNRIQTVDELSRLMWGSLEVPVTPTTDTQAFTSTSMLYPNIPNNAANSRYAPNFHDDDDYEDEVEARLAARRRERARNRKVVMISALSAISAIVVIFLIVIIISVANPDLFSWDSGSHDLQPNNNLNIVTVTAPEDEEPLDPTQEGQVTNFIGERFRESWEREARFNFLEFNFEAEYNDDPEFPYRTVFYQSIEAGAVVPFGTEITIIHSLGPEFVMMPDFAGLSVADLTSRLIDLGVNPMNITVQNQESPFHTDEGMVSSASIQPGESIRVTSFPGDNERQADTIIIYRAVPAPAEPPDVGNGGNQGGNNRPRPPRPPI
jgi:serine/threonine-protein kinase